MDKNSAAEEKQHESRATEKRQLSTYEDFSAESYVHSTNKTGYAENEIRKYSHASTQSSRAIKELNLFVKTTRIVRIWSRHLL